ncbi:hypothetical protein CCACVL1_12810 [Corchorus capsularis]|uniref:Uncharacterized protein n=1 Tax=Corchorus capsularis TaxID=210143 RepID=A0A1R3IDT0_COCAP|nr:hypothetical protein CCACVL1_12810 [Corchorus capsularis]
MDSPNPSPTQPTMDTVDWRSQLPFDLRNKIITHFLIIERKYARTEKMLMIEKKFKKTAQDTGNNSEHPGAGCQSMQQQNQIHSQGQTIRIPRPQGSNQRQQLLAQNVKNNMASSGFQSGMPPVPNVGGQNMSGISQNSMGQGIVPSHIYSIQQRQIQMQQGVQQQQQQQLIYCNNMNRPMKVQQGQVPRPDMQQPQQYQLHLQGCVPKMQSINAGQYCSMQHVAPTPLHQQANISSLPSHSQSHSHSHNGVNYVGKQNMNPLQSIENTSSLSSQSGLSVGQQNMNLLHSNPNMLQQQHLKQQQMLQSQQPGMGVKPHQQFRPGSQFPISSPQVASPKHSSPKVDQQSLLTSNIIEQPPLERLIKAVQSMPPVAIALGAAVSDIASVVIMSDTIADSAPGKTSEAAIGADLVSMTKCHLRARKFITKHANRMTRYINAMPLE